MTAATNYDIFISYTREDADAAKRLAEELAGHGWSIFWDRVLLPGATWRTQLQSALNAAKVVVVIWSENSVGSRWVEIEADHAFQRDVYLPVRVDSAPLPLGFGHVQIADLRPWLADPGHRLPAPLLMALGHRLRSTMVASPKSPPPPPPRPAAPGEDAATALAADGTIRFAGTAASGENYELIVRLSQLRAKPEGLVIGRAASQCDLVVAHASVSRRHALLRAGDGRLTLNDLDSTNGTLVDDKPAPSRERGLELTRGSVIRFGDVELVVEGVAH